MTNFATNWPVRQRQNIYLLSKWKVLVVQTERTSKFLTVTVISKSWILYGLSLCTIKVFKLKVEQKTSISIWRSYKKLTLPVKYWSNWRMENWYRNSTISILLGLLVNPMQLLIRVNKWITISDLSDRALQVQ